MAFGFTKDDTTFYDLFATSASHLIDGSQQLTKMLEVPAPDREPIAATMRDIEHAADEATHAIMRKVNSSFITPFDREDIYGLASNLDDCMDFMEAAADLIVLYRIGELPAGIAAQVEILDHMSHVTVDAMPRLRSMTDLSEYWIEINRLENHADQIHRRLLADLYNGDDDALTVLKLKEVIEQLEAAADAFEHVAHTVESIAVKES
jgi:uncharacterized protein